MSICPNCNGTGADPVKTAAMYAREPSATGYKRCWACNGNGNDTAKDFYEFKAWQNARLKQEKDNEAF